MASPPGSNSWLAASWEERKGKGRQEGKAAAGHKFHLCKGRGKKKKEIKGKQESELGSVWKAELCTERGGAAGGFYGGFGARGDVAGCLC